MRSGCFRASGCFFCVLTAALVGCRSAPGETFTAPDGTAQRAVSMQTLDNGVIIHEIRRGTGTSVGRDDTIVINTRGTYLLDGREFYSTFKEGKPLEARMSQLIPGFRDGVEGMKVDGIRRLTIPWQQAYGAEGRPDKDNPAEGIPPRADLVFWIELLEVRKAPVID